MGSGAGQALGEVLAGTSAIELRAAARTDVGMRRSANEDAFALAPKLGLFVVADGMGGHVAGQVASRLAARSLLQAVVSEREAALEPCERLQRAVAHANQEVFRTASAKPELEGMGTTLVAALVRGEQLGLVHVGDSRAYLSRAGELRQLTRDHTLVNELERRGELGPGEASDHPQRHVLTRALGVRRQVEADLCELTLTSGDALLLCSDGLTQHVSDAELAERLGSGGPPDEDCEALIELANSRGGEDNVTVALLRCL